MPWTKGKIEKAWRIFDKSMGVIADALDVPLDELKALILDGTLPIYDRTPAEEIRNMEAAGVDQSLAPKRATLADLAPSSPEVVLEQADPIIDKPLQFRPEPKRKVERSQVHTSLDDDGGSSGPQSLDRTFSRQDDRVRHKRTNEDYEGQKHPKPKAKPTEFYLMHEGRYLHQSCEGLTDKPEHAWRQPEGKIAAVRRKFPETVDYIEVPAK